MSTSIRAAGLMLLGATLVFFGLIACSSDDDDPAPTPTAEVSSTPQASVTPRPPTLTPTPVTSPTPSASAPTGISSVDRAIAAVNDRDAARLASLFQLEALACTNAVGLGGPPQCKPGEAPGTMVNVLFTSSCDGHYLRQDEVASLAGRFVEDTGKLAGVYRHNGKLFPSSEYVAVFSFQTPYGSLARVLFISEPGVVGVTFGCGTSAKEYIDVMGLRDPVYLPGG